jgi:hypothetical protein
LVTKIKEKTKMKSKNYALRNQVPEESVESFMWPAGKREGWINLAMLEGGAKFSKKFITNSQLFLLGGCERLEPATFD